MLFEEVIGEINLLAHRPKGGCSSHRKAVFSPINERRWSRELVKCPSEYIFATTPSLISANWARKNIDLIQHAQKSSKLPGGQWESLKAGEYRPLMDYLHRADTHSDLTIIFSLSSSQLRKHLEVWDCCHLETEGMGVNVATTVLLMVLTSGSGQTCTDPGLLTLPLVLSQHVHHTGTVPSPLQWISELFDNPQ